MHPCDRVPFIFKGINENGKPILNGDWSGGTNNCYMDSWCEWEEIRFLNETDDIAVNNVKQFFHF